jgi:hypothetical protein
MNDKAYLREYTNGPIANALVTIVIVLVCVVALVALPLQMLGGGGG